jgi:hypothetical protein
MEEMTFTIEPVDPPRLHGPASYMDTDEVVDGECLMCGKVIHHQLSPFNRAILSPIELTAHRNPHRCPRCARRLRSSLARRRH